MEPHGSSKNFTNSYTKNPGWLFNEPIDKVMELQGSSKIFTDSYTKNPEWLSKEP